MTLRSAAVVGVLFLGMPAAARQTPAPQTPVFRAGVDLVQLDASVLDKNRMPVRGLTEADFTLLENGKAQKIEAFTAIDLPDTITPATPWAYTVTPDVTSNEIDNHRIIIMVVDDFIGAGDLWAIQELKNSVKLIVSKMGPDDLAAVQFTRENQHDQSLTNDHAKLLKAVNKLSNLSGGSILKCVPEWNSVGVVSHAAEVLAAVPNRRKTIIYFTGSLPYKESPIGDDCSLVPKWQELFRHAQLANVNIYPVDTMGLRTDSLTSSRVWTSSLAGTSRYLTVAEKTGGKAIINTNDFEPGITQMFRENSSYYVLAYKPEGVGVDGTTRRLDVKVNRPDVQVRSRNLYYEPKAPKPGDVKAAPPSPSLVALSGLLPDATMPLRVAAAPFAGPNSQTATVTIALGFRQPLQTRRVIDSVDLLVRAFTLDGDPRGTADQNVAVTVPPTRRGVEFTRYEALAKIDLKPGRYQLRVSARSQMIGKQGSIYADVEVPDFANAPVSISGVALSVIPGVPSAPLDALSTVIPVIPTTEREFSRVDRVTAFLRVYQGGKGALAPVSLKTRVIDTAGTAVFESTDPIGADRFVAARAAEHREPLPLGQLAAGDYLLSFEATLGKRVVTRDIRFRVK